MDTDLFLSELYRGVDSRLLEKAQSIKLLSLDVDGVLTDGRLQFDAQGESHKAFNTLDGLGLKQLQHAGIQVAIITGRQSPMLSQRAQELGLQHVVQGCETKRDGLRRLCDDLNISLAQAAHMGDDLPDLPAMRSAGLGFAAADAHPFVRHHADWISTRPAGHGAVREACDLLLYAHGVLAATLDAYL